MEGFGKFIFIAMLFGGSYVYKNYTVVKQKDLQSLEFTNSINGKRYSIEQEYSILNCCVYKYSNKQRCICALKMTQQYYSFYEIQTCSNNVFMNYYNNC